MHLKRTEAPVFWPMERKTARFAVAPLPGAHAKRSCIPLGIVLRDVLDYAETLREAKHILRQGQVRVDSTVRRDHRLPVGLMDILTVGDETYRMLPDRKGLRLQKTSGEDAKLKLLKILDKTYTRNGVQLNLHDGRNILVPRDEYKTKDTVVFDLEAKSIKSVLKLKKGAAIMVTNGNKRGMIGKVVERVVTRTPQPNTVIVEADSETIPIPEHYIFVIGDGKPAVTIQ
ncbi:MAG: 30S ribosomal protein S4e [Candidatus Aenigmarchaeota archaeon]|nr:30S ribosomal protein S4e [Candidatus Aenigmarchaeota archaeon]